MELRQLAEQIVFASTLEEKLQCPEVITDDHPGVPLPAPPAPGRPPELQFKPPGSSKAEFPGLHRLDHEPERGRLLHFFANHELLATELMALVLLRFPDAPAEFRRGILRTLKEEQAHTRLYLERMRHCGIQFGELPVSGFFWRAVSKMEHPIDYVAGLSLTLEQANLDFCRHFERGFQIVGDLPTANLLGQIYRDEIAHVAYGLKWFRRWKNPCHTDWEAFCRQLKFPLTPQRAKGISLNVEGRRAAGLDPGFIDELAVFSQSKGRTPNVFLFNPFAEGRIAQGRGFSPVKAQTLLARDLANLPQFLCRQDDILLLPKRPSIQFLSAIKQAGFPLPEFIEVPHGRIDPNSNLARRKIGRLRPWAWGPDSLEVLAPLIENVTAEERSHAQRFNHEIARLYSKAWSAELLRRIICDLPKNAAAQGDPGATPDHSPATAPDPSWLCTEREIGVAVSSLDEALHVIASIRQGGHHRLVLKQAFGLAGHNSIRLWEPDLLENQRRWIANAVRNQAQIVIEPWLDRAADFSIQLEMGLDGLKLRGYTGLINNLKGQFQANWAEPKHELRPPSRVIDLLRKSGHNAYAIPPADVSAQLNRLYSRIFTLLEQELRRADFIGPIAIDAFLYRTGPGECRLKPIVEINPRYTMGRLTLELMSRTAPGTYGLFRLVNRGAVQAEGFPNFASYARELAQRFPLRCQGEPVPKIREGALCLNDPEEARICLAIFQASRTSPL